jgi:hypothetical protein
MRQKQSPRRPDRGSTKDTNRGQSKGWGSGSGGASSDCVYILAMLRARREHPHILEGLERDARARQWEVSRRRATPPIDQELLEAAARECSDSYGRAA